MKQSQEVAKVNVGRMARMFGVTSTMVKLALAGKKPQPVDQSFQKERDVAKLSTMYQKASTTLRKRMILAHAISVCGSIEEMREIYELLRHSLYHPRLLGPYAKKYQSLVQRRFAEANEFEALYNLYKIVSQEFAPVEKAEIYDHLYQRATTTSPLRVVACWRRHGDDNVALICHPTSNMNDIFVHSCESAPTNQAIEALESLAESGILKHHGDTDAVQILLRKAAVRYPG